MANSVTTLQILEAAFDAIDHIEEVDTFVDKIRRIAAADGSPQILTQANRISEAIQEQTSKTGATILGVGKTVFGALASVAPPPFGTMVGLLGELCGAALKVEANREAVTNLTNRLLALRPAILELVRRQVNPKDLIVKNIIQTLEKAFSLITKCVPPPPDPKDGIFSGFLSFGKSIINQVTTNTQDFAEVHAAIDRTLNDFNFTALVNAQAPSSKQLQDWMELDAAVLRSQMEDIIKQVSANATDAVKSEMAKLQNDISVATSNLAKKTDQMAVQMKVLLRETENERLQIAEDRVKIFEVIGSGGNGEVKTAMLDGGTMIVAKCQKRKQTGFSKEAQEAAANAAKSSAKDIVNEAKLLMRCPHPNIIRCYGITVKNKDTYLLLDMCHQDLHTAIQKSARRVTPDVAAVILLKTSAALSALHRAGQVHRDVKAQNVMVREDGELFLIDMGSAKAEVQNSMASTGSTGNLDAAGTTLLFAAPEILNTLIKSDGGTYRATKKCDVYAFGMLMYNVFTSQVPFSEETVSQYVLFPKIAEGLRPTLPNDVVVPKPMLRLMHDCWHTDPDRRPRIDQVLDRIGQFLAEETDNEREIEWLERWKKFYAENIKDHDMAPLMQKAQSIAYDSGAGPMVCLPEEILPNIARKCANDCVIDEVPTLSEVIAYAKDVLFIPTATTDIFVRMSLRNAPITLTVACAFFVESLKILHREFLELATNVTLQAFLVNRMTKMSEEVLALLMSPSHRFSRAFAAPPGWLELCIGIDELFAGGIHQAAAPVHSPLPSLETPTDNSTATLLPAISALFLSNCKDGTMDTGEVVSLLRTMGFRDAGEHELRRRQIRRGRETKRNAANSVLISVDAFCDFVAILLEDIFVDAPTKTFKTNRDVCSYVAGIIDIEVPTESVSVTQPLTFQAFAAVVDSAFKKVATPTPALSATAARSTSSKSGAVDISGVACIRVTDCRHDPNGCTITLHGKDVLLRGFDADVLCASFHPDGKRLATGTDNQAAPIKVWSLESGTALMSLKGHKDVVGCITFNSEGTLLASGSCDKTAKVYNMTTGKAIATLTGHTSDVNCICFAPDSSFLVTGSDDTTATVWEPTKGTVIAQLLGHTFWVRCAAVNHQSNVVATGSSDKTIKLWNAKTGALLLSIVVGEPVASLAFSDDDTTLRATTEAGETKSWNTSSGKMQ